MTILRENHDDRLAGHPGQNGTYTLLKCHYYWKGMKNDAEQYVKSCETYSCTKIQTYKRYRPLKPLMIPSQAWSSISMDFIEDLPTSEGHNSILVVVDRFTKMAHFIPTTTTLDSLGLARLLFDHMFSKHGLPEDIVSDRGSKFTSTFWRALMQLIGVDQRLSTTFHPQTDGRTERVNQWLEQYLRMFSNYQQDDWTSLLAMAEFAYNNSEHSATSVSPFQANYGRHPHMITEPHQPRESDEHLTITSKEAEIFAEDMADLHRYLFEELGRTKKIQAKFFDVHRLPAPE